jgi:hypothetical protein
VAQVGVDFLCDVHGDEGLPYAFTSGIEGVPSFLANEGRLKKLQEAFADAFVRSSNGWFQTEQGYGKMAPNTANLNLCKSGFSSDLLICLLSCYALFCVCAIAESAFQVKISFLSRTPAPAHPPPLAGPARLGALIPLIPFYRFFQDLMDGVLLPRERVLKSALAMGRGLGL